MAGSTTQIATRDWIREYVSGNYPYSGVVCPTRSEITGASGSGHNWSIVSPPDGVAAGNIANDQCVPQANIGYSYTPPIQYVSLYVSLSTNSMPEGRSVWISVAGVNATLDSGNPSHYETIQVRQNYSDYVSVQTESGSPSASISVWGIVSTSGSIPAGGGFWEYVFNTSAGGSIFVSISY